MDQNNQNTELEVNRRNREDYETLISYIPSLEDSFC